MLSVVARARKLTYKVLIVNRSRVHLVDSRILGNCATMTDSMLLNLNKIDKKSLITKDCGAVDVENHLVVHDSFGYKRF